MEFTPCHCLASRVLRFLKKMLARLSPYRLKPTVTELGGGTNLSQILFNADFSGGTVGAAGPNAAGYYAAQTGSVYDDQNLESGKTRTVKQTATSGVDEPTVGTSYTLATKLAKGDEIWHSIRIYFPVGWDFTTSTGFKWMRFRTETAGAVNKGYAEIQFDQFDGPDESFSYIKEQEDVWEYFDEGAGANAPTLGTYETYDFYMLADDVPVSLGGNGIARFWKNKVLIGEITNRKTLTDATDLVVSALFHTYWNGGAPATQSMWIGGEAYAVKRASDSRDDTPHLTTDTGGNRLIALGM